MTGEAPPQRWRVPEEARGERLDRHIAARLAVARHQVQRWIRDGRVELDGAPVKASHLLAGGETIRCRPPSPAGDQPLAPEAGELEILWEDEELVALDKPAGIAVHRGAGRTAGTLANRLLGRYPEIGGVGGPGRPGIVHRLDLDTTGVMVVARTPAAYRALSTAFAERGVDKRYLGIVYGEPHPAAGQIDRPLGRHPRDRKKMAVRSDGRPAVTGYRTLDTAPGLAVLELKLITGRTHQIRVHLKASGHPLIGDPVYGEARWRDQPAARRRLLRDFPRPALHAWRLTLDHPTTGERLTFTAQPPADLRRLWRELADRELPP